MKDVSMVALARPVTPSPVSEWPEKRPVFGVGVSACDTGRAVAAIMAAAKNREPAAVSCFSVHSLVSASNDPSLNHQANSFEMVTADGQPVRWALNLLHRTGLEERVT